MIEAFIDVVVASLHERILLGAWATIAEVSRVVLLASVIWDHQIGIQLEAKARRSIDLLLELFGLLGLLFQRDLVNRLHVARLWVDELLSCFCHCLVIIPWVLLLQFSSGGVAVLGIPLLLRSSIWLAAFDLQETGVILNHLFLGGQVLVVSDL